MSGPKAVNIRIHNAILRQIVLKQSEIRILEDSIDSFQIEDAEHKYLFSDSEITSDYRQAIKECMESIEIPKDTILSANQNLAFADLINKKMMALLKTISVLKKLKKEREESYCNYLKSKQALSELETLRNVKCERLNNIILKLEDNIRKASSDFLSKDAEDSLSRLKQICTNFKLPEFNLEIHKKKKDLVNEILAFYKEQEDKIYEIQTAYHNNINLEIIKQKSDAQQADSLRQSLYKEINILLETVSDCETKSQLSKDYNYLINNPEYASKSSFQHIKSKLLLLSKSVERRNELRLIENRAMMLPQNNQTRQFKTLLQKEISADIISETRFTKLCKAWETLEAEQIRNQENSYYQEQESRFIKEKLVKALQDLNYTVVSDAKGLQELSNSYVFKVPDQDNYIYVEYLKGKFLYNFMVPEKVADLSREDLRRKVSDMCKACDGFLQALEMLKALGINYDYTYKEASERYVISIPTAIRKSIDENLMAEKQHKAPVKAYKRMKHD